MPACPRVMIELHDSYRPIPGTVALRSEAPKRPRDLTLSLLAVAITAVTLLGAALGPVAAHGQSDPAVTVPSVVRPGHEVAVRVSGFPAGDRVFVQWAVFLIPPRLCCTSSLFPPAGSLGKLIGADGSATIHMSMPRRYAQCIIATCTSPHWRHWKPGEQVYVVVADGGPGYGVSARAHSRIAR